MAYSRVSSPETVERMVASPQRTSWGAATAIGVPRKKASSVTVPKMPLLLLMPIVPMSRCTEKSPFSSPGSPAAPFFTALTEVGIIEPFCSVINWAVSTSVMP